MPSQRTLIRLGNTVTATAYWLLLLLLYSSTSLTSYSPVVVVAAFAPSVVSPTRRQQQRTATCTTTLLEANAGNNNNSNKASAGVDVSRRQVLSESGPAFLIAASSSFLAFQLSPQPAFAKDNTVEEDKAKILKGYERVNYLLNNWDKLTTKCGVERDPFTGEQVCEKNPLVVQDYIGYKSMNDPLFKADKTLRRLEDLVPPSRETEYFDCIERWSTTAEEASGMAYTSSWAGPQNPNGGDESIAYYLERSKKQVTGARDTLAKVIDILQL